MAQQQPIDIIIIGAGLVGTSLACALRHSGLNITLLENHLLDLNQAPNPHSRPISLAHSSRVLLEQLGIWPALQAHTCAIEQVHVSEQGAFGQLRFNAADYQIDALGYVVPFDELRYALYRQAAESQHHNIICIEQIESIEQHDDHVHVSVKQAGQTQHYRASLLIAADGTRSQCRDLLSIGIQQTDHQETAFTASLQLNQQLHTAYERFSPLGTLAILPRSNKTAGMVWTMEPKQAGISQQWSGDEWREQIQRVIGYRVGRIDEVKINASYPLITTVANQQVQGRAALLGNSAHTFYPIAAQGFNLSLRDVAVLADQLMQAPLSDYATSFEHYLKQRLHDQQRVQRLIGFTANTFDLKFPCAKTLRGAGLLTVACLPSIKKRLAKRTLGLSGKLNSLMAGLQHD